VSVSNGVKNSKSFPDPGKACVLKRKVAKIAFLRLFTSIHRPSLNQGSVFSLRKFQIQILRMFLSLEGSFPEKIFEIFFTWVVPYCIVAPNFLAFTEITLNTSAKMFSFGGGFLYQGLPAMKDTKNHFFN
jgi:hypothetical protein